MSSLDSGAPINRIEIEANNFDPSVSPDEDGLSGLGTHLKRSIITTKSVRQHINSHFLECGAMIDQCRQQLNRYSLESSVVDSAPRGVFQDIHDQLLIELFRTR